MNHKADLTFGWPFFKSYFHPWLMDIACTQLVAISQTSWPYWYFYVYETSLKMSIIIIILHM